jgi:hypothetical protein
MCKDVLIERKKKKKKKKKKRGIKYDKNRDVRLSKSKFVVTFTIMLLRTDYCEISRQKGD